MEGEGLYSDKYFIFFILLKNIYIVKYWKNMLHINIEICPRMAKVHISRYIFHIQG